MPLTSAALLTELNADPRAYGYAPRRAAADYEGLADLLNKPRDGTDGTPLIRVRREAIPVTEIMETVPLAEYNSLSAANKQWLQMLFTVGEANLLKADGSDTVIAANLKALFGQGTAARAALVAAAQRIGSRAEELWGTGASVGSTDVRLALGG